MASDGRSEVRSSDVDAITHPTESDSPTALLDLLKEDDVYIALTDHFLRQNKGRRPKLPLISTLTNGLLVQFNLMKEQSNCSFRELKTWLEKLFPDIATVTESRIAHRIKTILDLCRCMSTEDAKPFMLEPFSFHALSPPLTAIGLNRLHLTDIEQFIPDFAKTITNEVIVHLDKFRNCEGMPPIFVRKWVKTLCNCSNLTDSMIRTKVEKVLKTQKSLSNRKKMHDLNLYLNNPFLADISDSENRTTMKSCVSGKLLKEVHKSENAEPIIESLEREKLSLNLQLESKDEVIHQQIIEAAILKKDQDQKIKDLTKVLKESKKTCQLLNEELENTKKSKLYKKNSEYKTNLSNLMEEKDKIEQEFEVEKSKSSKLSESLKHSRCVIKHEQTMKSKYKTSLTHEKKKNSGLMALLTCDGGNDVKLREEGSSHRYSNDVRQTFYALQGEASVAAGNCSKVVETVAKHLFKTNITKDHLPSPSTSVNFSHEAHVIAKHQAASEILRTDHFTYASDGTSRQKAHYLEQHIILSDGKQLSLGFSEIASDDSETLLEKCVALFKDLCEVYCLDEENVDGNEVLKEIIRKMTVLLSDRAAVNKAFNTKMSNYKHELLGGEDCSIHFIFCNAHFLLALSSAAENALLKVIEKEAVLGGVKLGRDSQSKFSGFSSSGEGAALRLIRTAAEVLGPRGDEKSGCRQEWLAFCTSRDIKSTFSSFRNNRFNNLFQNAFSILCHRLHIKEFLNEFVSHSNMKLQSVLADLEDERIITSISVLSFLYVCLTDPYWRLMNSSKSYADFSYYVQKMKYCLNLWSSFDFVVNNESVTSVFDEEFKACDSDVSIVKDFLNSDLFDQTAFISCLQEIVQFCSNALNRQLSDFLEGGTFGGDLADDVRQILSTCPLTNLTGERLFGDLDYCINKRRNASLILRSTTNMWKHNQTAKWLDKQSPRVTQKLMERAIRYGLEWKKRSLDDKKAVKEKVQERIAENKRKKDEKAIKLAERKSAALDAILAEGGCIVSTKEQLDELYSGPRAVERMKDQIRFRNLVRRESITLVGNKKTLYERLLQHITITDKL